MRFTDIFINKPVFASVLSILLLLSGLQSIDKLSLREFPKLEQTVISINTSFPGANADLIQGFISTPIQRAVAEADGIDYITAKSSTGSSSVSVNVKDGYDADVVFNDVMAKVAQVRKQLPLEAEEPLVAKTTGGGSDASMYISFTSSRMTNAEITDYVTRIVQPKLSTIPGVASASLMGGKKFALRIWLDSDRMTALGVDADDMVAALKRQNYQASPGKLRSLYTLTNIRIDTDLTDVDTFKNLVIKQDEGTLVRLQDIAKVELGVESENFSILYNDKTAVFSGIMVAPGANPLTVANQVTRALPQLEAEFPPNLHINVAYDATRYIQQALDEVQHTILEVSIIVVLVIFLFLGSIRTVLIPMVTIPLSLVGVCSFLWAMGYSLNLLTLLAMVLAIGLVVDDAIVVVENIHRHIEEGLNPFAAAINGAREIVFPVIAMTITLAAVYTPIMMTSGLTGTLFSEFAFTLAMTVIISGFIALTLSPMMCSKLLSSKATEGGFAQYMDQLFNRFRRSYERFLHITICKRPLVGIVALVLILACGLLYTHIPQELAPPEDQSVLFAAGNASVFDNHNYMNRYIPRVVAALHSIPEMNDYFLANGAFGENSMFSGAIFKPWKERERSPQQVQYELQQKLDAIPGLQLHAFAPSPLPGQRGLPVQFVLTSSETHQFLYEASQQLIKAANQSGKFMFVNGDLKFNNPQLELRVDRAKAGQLGISMQAIASAVSVLLNNNYSSRFSKEGQSYEIIAQLPKSDRQTNQQLLAINVKTQSGAMVPLSTVVSVGHSVQPPSLNQYQQLNAVTISGMMMPGLTIGDALDYLTAQTKALLPKSINYSYLGMSKQFIEEGNTLMYAFIFACILIFLVLAAQFESYSDPLIILISVPLSLFGALLVLYLGGFTLNIYSKIGLLTLIGLISKAGILMVEFANKLRDADPNLSRKHAIEQAASLRLRPILMTTVSMVVGVMPLVFASGPGSQSRQVIGVVIAGGMAIGTVFTLFVVPVFYTWLARAQRQAIGEHGDA